MMPNQPAPLELNELDIGFIKSLDAAFTGAEAPAVPLFPQLDFTDFEQDYIRAHVRRCRVLQDDNNGLREQVISQGQTINNLRKKLRAAKVLVCVGWVGMCFFFLVDFLKWLR